MAFEGRGWRGVCVCLSLCCHYAWFVVTRGRLVLAFLFFCADEIRRYSSPRRVLFWDLLLCCVNVTFCILVSALFLSLSPIYFDLSLLLSRFSSLSLLFLSFSSLPPSISSVVVPFITLPPLDSCWSPAITSKKQRNPFLEPEMSPRLSHPPRGANKQCRERRPDGLLGIPLARRSS